MVKHFVRIVTADAWPQVRLIGWLACLAGAVAASGIALPANAAQSIYVRASEPARGPEGQPASLRATAVASDLREGLRLARRLRRQHPGEASIVITLQSGIHRISEAVRLGPEDSGTANAPLIIRGEGGAATLSGGIALASPDNVEGFAEARGMGVPEGSLSRLVGYELPDVSGAAATIGVERTLGTRSQPMPFELFDALGPLSPARWPNIGYASASRLPGSSATLRVPAPDIERVEAWTRSPDAWLGGYLRHEYSYETRPVSELSAKTGEISFAPSLGEARESSVRYALHHVASELDAPGEWVRSRDRRSVHVWARPGGGAVEASLARNLLLVENARHVRFERITLERSRGGAVRVNGGLGIVFADCEVRETGGFGVEFGETSDSRVERCRFNDVGEEGVRLGGGERSTLSPGRNAVIDTTFERFSRLGRSYRPAVAITGVGQSVTGSYFADAPHAAIIISGNDHLVETNEIARVAAECSDCGAIYMFRDWTARGTIIKHNFLHDIDGGKSGSQERDVKGIYLDDFTSGITVAENVILRVDQGVFIGGGRDNLVERNIFVASEPAVHIDGRGMTWAHEAIGDPAGELRAHLAAMPVASPVWRARYPRLADILSAAPERPVGNRVIGNLFAAAEPLRLLPEVRPSEVESTGGNLHEPIDSADAGRLAAASRAADLRRLAARELVRLGLSGLPLERMDRSKVIGAPPPAAVRR
ncbi:MAG: right-handed parallel beta-helix repeat-containing protein [Alphaproteobacteria bacterium]|nr:right-handed parallel beta-helix repeat-containing protein [Alphaproteobacteria bacterium]